MFSSRLNENYYWIDNYEIIIMGQGRTSKIIFPFKIARCVI